MKEWIVDHKFYILAAALFLAGGLYYYYVYQPDAAQNQQISTVEKSVSLNKATARQPDQPGQSKQSEKVKTVMVDVKGEVKQPGVYQAKDSERVNDVIKRAGGLTTKADESQVNLAAHVQDEMMIFIPAKGEGGSNTTAASAATISTVPATVYGSTTNIGKININKADENELQNLPGIGPAKAAAILQYRNENGPFQTVEDLKKISGIGEKTFEKLKDSISVQ